MSRVLDPLAGAPAGAAPSARCVVAAPPPALAGGDWNDQQVKWRTYDDGLAEAKKAKKPVC